MTKPYRSIEFDGATGLARKMNRSLDGDGAAQRGTGRALSWTRAGSVRKMLVRSTGWMYNERMDDESLTERKR